MKLTLFNAQVYDKASFNRANERHGHAITYFEAHLNAATAKLAEGADAVCTFVNDELDAETLESLKAVGVRVVALRCAGYNQVDLNAAEALGLTVVRVPDYSPHAVAEHAIALILSLNRKIYKAHNRVRDGNFKLQGLMGFDLYGKTVGVVGTGKIGIEFCKIMLGFSCRVVAYDPFPSKEVEKLGIEYCNLPELLRASDIVSLHCPLTPQTQHLIDEEAFDSMKPDAMLVNTSRGGLIDTKAMIRALKSTKLGSVALDVYEEEASLFFEDMSSQLIQDDIFSRLLTFPNVLITAHQAFFTREAITNIAETTLDNLTCLEQQKDCGNVVSPRNQ